MNIFVHISLYDDAFFYRTDFSGVRLLFKFFLILINDARLLSQEALTSHILPVVCESMSFAVYLQ